MRRRLVSRTVLLVSEQCGATALQFAIVAVLFFGIIGGLFDVGVTLWRYSMLTHLTSRVSRNIESSLNATMTLPAPGCDSAPVSCDQLEKCALQMVKDTYQSMMGSKPQGLTTQLHVNNGSPVTAQLTNTIPANCFFCIFFPNQLNLRARAVAQVDVRGFECT